MTGMNAIVLAGGLGTRLREVVSDVPKPMAPVAGRPFLQYILDYLAGFGVQTVALAVGYKYEVVQDCFGSEYAGMRVRYSVESQPCGTGGGIRQAADLLDDEDLLVLNGDTFFAADLAALADFHRRTGASLTVAAKPMADCARYGTMVLDPAGRITGFAEKRPGASGHINGGIYAMSPRLLADRPLGQRFSFETEVLESGYDTQAFYALVCDAYFIDIGIPADYDRACRELPGLVGA